MAAIKEDMFKDCHTILEGVYIVLGGNFLRILNKVACLLYI